MRAARRDRVRSENLHALYSAYVDVPSIIPSTDVPYLIRYIELVVAYRHPQLHLMTFLPREFEGAPTPASNQAWRYLFSIEVLAGAESWADLLDATMLEAATALNAHCKLKDGRKLGVGLAAVGRSLASRHDCTWCQRL